LASYVLAVIATWRNAASRKGWEGRRSIQFRDRDLEAAVDLLLALDVAHSLADLSPLKSVGLHKFSGDRQGQWAISVNGPWRIRFEFRKANAYDVEIANYHRG
jgi:proteic killer suppression protein